MAEQDGATPQTGKMSVAATERLCRKYGYQAILVLGVNDEGTVEIMSAGRSRADCRIMGNYAQGEFGGKLPVAPFQTWFGVGTGGVPTAVDEAGLATLGAKGRAYVETNTHPKAVQPGVAPQEQAA